MPRIPLRRLRAVLAVSAVISGLSALPATANLPDGKTASTTTSASSDETTTVAAAVGPTTVVPAARFVDSVGVGVHLTQRDSSYMNYPAVKRALLDLGVKHIRDGLFWDPAKFLDLSQSGIKVLATVPRTADTDAELTKVLTNARKWRPALSAIGGPNEYETTVTDWVTKLRSFQRRVYTQVKADSTLSALPVLAPSLRTATDETLLGDLTAYLDAGAVHAYPWGQQPEEKAAHYVREAQVTSGSEPVVVTETGMASGDQTLRLQHGLAYSDRAAGIYTPRLLLEYFRLGVRRSYIYELLNEDNRADLFPVRNRYFGLMTKDFTPRPAYLSVRTLLRTLADSGPQVTPRALSYNVSSSKALRQLTFQKSDGSYYVALWNPVSVWSGGPKGHELYPDPVPATLTLPFTARSVQVVDLSRGLTPVQTVTGTNQVRVDVTPSVRLVKITR